MRYANFRTYSRLTLAISLLGVVVSTAHADPTPPTYSMIDLGSRSITATAANGTAITVDATFASGQGNQMLSADASGSQIVAVSNGQTVYPFSLSPETTTLTPNQGILSNFPVPVGAPVNGPGTYGDPANAYSMAIQPIMNANGIVVAVDSSGVFGHEGSDVTYYVQHNADGSWGRPVSMWGGNTQYSGEPAVAGLSVTGMNNSNQVLGEMGVGGISNVTLTHAVVYDINSHSLIDLTSLLASQGYHDIHPLAIDDQGRILLWAALGTTSEDTLLLTPDGVSSNPIILTTPEPGSWAVMALTMAAFAANRVRERRRRS